MALLIAKRLQKSDLDIDALGKNTDQLAMATRDASDACMDMMTWLTPSSSKLTTGAAGVEDAIGLVLMELSIKGFTVTNNITDLQTLIPLNLTRNAFMAALLSLTDASQAPAKVTVNGELNGSELRLHISVQRIAGVPPVIETPSYRNIDWEDVLALAEADSVVLSRSANYVQLAFTVQPIID